MFMNVLKMKISYTTMWFKLKAWDGEHILTYHNKKIKFIHKPFNLFQQCYFTSFYIKNTNNYYLLIITVQINDDYDSNFEFEYALEIHEPTNNDIHGTKFSYLTLD